MRGVEIEQVGSDQIAAEVVEELDAVADQKIHQRADLLRPVHLGKINFAGMHPDVLLMLGVLVEQDGGAAVAGGLGAAVFLLVWLAGPRLLQIAYRSDYADLFDAFLTLVSGQCIILLASAFGYVLTQMRVFWAQVPIHVK